MSDNWWLKLKSGDRVFVPMERISQSGMAEVYSNGKKYIHISLKGTPLKIRKSDGCVDVYPNNQVCRDEKDHQDAVWQRKRFRDSLDLLIRAAGRKRITEKEADALQSVVDKINEVVE